MGRGLCISLLSQEPMYRSITLLLRGRFSCEAIFTGIWCEVCFDVVERMFFTLCKECVLVCVIYLSCLLGFLSCTVSSSESLRSKKGEGLVHAAFLGAADVLSSTGESNELRPYWESKLVLEHASYLSSRGFQAVLGITNGFAHTMRKSMLEQLEHFQLEVMSQLENGSNMVIALSAHGSKSTGKIAFLWPEGDAGYVHADGLAFKWQATTETLKEKGVKLGAFVLIIDACHAEGFRTLMESGSDGLFASLPPASVHVLGLVSGGCPYSETNGYDGGESSLVTPWIRTLAHTPPQDPVLLSSLLENVSSHRADNQGDIPSSVLWLVRSSENGNQLQEFGGAAQIPQEAVSALSTTLLPGGQPSTDWLNVLGKIPDEHENDPWTPCEEDFVLLQSSQPGIPEAQRMRPDLGEIEQDLESSLLFEGLRFGDPRSFAGGTPPQLPKYVARTIPGYIELPEAVQQLSTWKVKGPGAPLATRLAYRPVDGRLGPACIKPDPIVVFGSKFGGQKEPCSTLDF